MIHDQDEAKELLAEVIAKRNAQQKEIDQLRYQATGRVPIYDLAIGDFPPSVRNNPIECLRYFFCTMFGYVTPGEFDALTPDELKARVENNIAFEKMKEFWNGKIDELKNGIAAVGADAHAGRVAAEGAKEAADATCANVNDGFDSVCETVGAKFQEINNKEPPTIEDITIEDALLIYEKMQKVKGVDDPHKSTNALELFIKNSKLSIRGWTLQDMQATPESLRNLKHRCKVWLNRNPSK